MKRLLFLLLPLLGLTPQQPRPTHVVFDWDAISQLRFLYQHMRTEFAGCLYGQQRHDSVLVMFFIPSSTDPRLASDSNVYQGSCQGLTTTLGNHLVGIFHSHIRYTQNCFPSGYTEPLEEEPHKDRSVIIDWERAGALFGAIMCSKGDSIVVYTSRSRADGSGMSTFAIPPLDSLYVEQLPLRRLRR